MIPSFVLPAGTMLEGVLGTYVVDSYINHDGFGVTYKAFSVPRQEKNSKGRRPFVIREQYMNYCCDRGPDGCSVMVKPGLEATVATFRDDFRRLSSILMDITTDSPALVNVMDRFDAFGTSYYITEFLSGQHLDEYIAERGPLSLPEAHALLQPIFDGLRRCHGHQLLHTDICPAHMSMAVEGNSKVAVLIKLYGCKLFNEDNQPSWHLPPAVCKPGYSAPELFCGYEANTPQLDIYSLCAVLVFVLTGKTPPGPEELSEESLRAMLPHDLPDSFVDAVIHGMKRNPAERPPTLTALSQELMTYSGTRHSVTRHVERPGEDNRTTERWWTPIKDLFSEFQLSILGIVVAALVIVLTIIFSL